MVGWITCESTASKVQWPYRKTRNTPVMSLKTGAETSVVFPSAKERPFVERKATMRQLLMRRL